MPEQQRQDEDSEHHTHSSTILYKKSTQIPKNAAKAHKVKRHRKRHQKYSSLSAVHRTSQVVVDMETIVDTPLPPSIGEAKETSVTIDEIEHETDAALPAVSPLHLAKPVVPTTPLPVEDVDTVGQKQRLHSRHTLLVYALLALLLTTMLLLWQDLTSTHVLVNTIDAKHGSLRVQQDLGGYRDAVHLTAPLSTHTASAKSILLGAYASDTRGTQQLLMLNGTASTLSLQHSVSLANGAITSAANGYLLVESANGLQVLTQDGQVVWQVQGEQPSRGVHHFQPVSDTETVYSVRSVIHSQVAAYNLGNGQTRWVQTLNDTLNYAPPFLLDGQLLYVASDHHVFALNVHDGSVLWEKPFASRTLLLENEGQNHLLIALGSQGVQALQGATGEIAWSFRGNPGESELPTQFYQGNVGRVSSINGNIIYATGVVWQMPNVREYVWLYAIDAATGEILWSRQIASGLTAVDAGRELQPLLDRDNGIIVLQRAGSGDESEVTAYDANTGTQRWNTHITDIHTSSPVVFPASNRMLAVFTTTTNSKNIFWTPSLYRICTVLLLLGSVGGLLLLLLLPQEQGRLRIQGIAQSIRTLLTSIRPRWHYAYTLSALAVLCVCIGVSIFVYTRSSSPTRQLLTIDAQGSIVTTSTGANMHQLEALSSNGTREWKLFSSEGAFSIPRAQAHQAGTLLVALHGHVAGSYVVAEDDPAYPRPLDSMLALYLLDRTTGHILWQQVVSYPDEQQNAEVIGADATYIYLAGEHTTISAQTGAKSIKTSQLFAVNQVTGTVDWRVFGPTQSDSKRHTHSTLLTKNGQVFWQVGGTVFTIDTSVGQIIARK